MLFLLSTAFAADAVWTAPSGVSIHMPAAPTGSPEVEIWSILYWPGTDPVQANVNVQRQHFPAGLDAWWDASKAQFVAFGMTVIGQQRTKVGGHDALRVEYNGAMGGNALHWDAVGVLVGQDVWLATCTAPEAGWATWKPLCKQAIDSFSVP